MVFMVDLFWPSMDVPRITMVVAKCRYPIIPYHVWMLSHQMVVHHWLLTLIITITINHRPPMVRVMRATWWTNHLGTTWNNHQAAAMSSQLTSNSTQPFNSWMANKLWIAPYNLETNPSFRWVNVHPKPMNVTSTWGCNVSRPSPPHSYALHSF